MNTIRLPVQWTIAKTPAFDNLPRWFDAFLLERKSQGMKPGTLYFYAKKLILFDTYCYHSGVSGIWQLTPGIIREFMLSLEDSGHNPGGQHAVYRAIRTFLNWYEAEDEPDKWQNPIRKVKPPKLQSQPLEPLDLNILSKLISVCPETPAGLRDKAILLFLLDTGIRAAELCALDRADVDEIQGSALIRSGKGGKSRMVVFGRKCRKALRLYLKGRVDDEPALWISQYQSRLDYWSLRNLLNRHAKQARVKAPAPHDFRRAFALSCLRNGMDVYSLQRLLGHSDLQVLRRYLAQTDGDLMTAHAKASPVDNARL